MLLHSVSMQVVDVGMYSEGEGGESLLSKFFKGHEVEKYNSVTVEVNVAVGKTS